MTEGFSRGPGAAAPWGDKGRLNDTPRYTLGSLARAAFSDPLPGCPGLRLGEVVRTADRAAALVASAAATAAGPRCGEPSDRVHSRYRRTAAGLPCAGRPLALRLVVRRFRCANPGCPRAVFCERLPGLLAPHARSAARLTESHRSIGFALGGGAGSRLSGRLDLPASPDTLPRRVKDAPDEPAPPPRYAGVDDWALRKGQRHGTALIDLERGRVIDVFEGRDGAALASRRKAHPRVEVITRDRWAAFARAAAVGTEVVVRVHPPAGRPDRGRAGASGAAAGR